MAGMIDEARNAPAPVGAKADSLSVTADSVRASMNLPKDMADQYDRLVLAAKKIMYSDQLKPQMDALLQGPESDGEKIGKGVVGVMGLLITHMNGTMPPQLIIPVATELVADAGDFMVKAGYKISDADVAEGMAVMVEQILSSAGVSPEQIPDLLAQGQGGQAPAQSGQAPAQGGQAPAVAPDGRPVEA